MDRRRYNRPAKGGMTWPISSRMASLRLLSAASVIDQTRRKRTTHAASGLHKALIGRSFVNQGEFACPSCPDGGEGEVSVTFHQGTEEELKAKGFQ